MTIFKKLFLFTSVPCMAIGSYWCLNPQKFEEHKKKCITFINSKLKCNNTLEKDKELCCNKK